MASISTILSKERERLACVHLYREGIFLVAYDWSAYLFFRYVREYQIRKKHYKCIHRDVCLLGFPSKVFMKVAEGQGESIKETTDGFEITITGSDADEEGFSTWEQRTILRKEIMEHSPSMPTNPLRGSSNKGHEQLIECIRSFDLVNQTPMKCVMFIADLQQQLKNSTMELSG